MKGIFQDPAGVPTVVGNKIIFGAEKRPDQAHWSWKDQGRLSYGCPWKRVLWGRFECGGKRFELWEFLGWTTWDVSAGCFGVSAGWTTKRLRMIGVSAAGWWCKTHSAWAIDGEVVWCHLKWDTIPQIAPMQKLNYDNMIVHPGLCITIITTMIRESSSPSSSSSSPPWSENHHHHHHHHHHHDQKIIIIIIIISIIIIIIIIIEDIIPDCPIICVFPKILIISNFMRKYYLQTTLSSVDSRMSLLVMSISDFLFQLLHDSLDISWWCLKIVQ